MSKYPATADRTHQSLESLLCPVQPFVSGQSSGDQTENRGRTMSNWRHLHHWSSCSNRDSGDETKGQLIDADVFLSPSSFRWTFSHRNFCIRYRSQQWLGTASGSYPRSTGQLVRQPMEPSRSARPLPPRFGYIQIKKATLTGPCVGAARSPGTPARCPVFGLKIRSTTKHQKIMCCFMQSHLFGTLRFQHCFADKLCTKQIFSRTTKLCEGRILLVRMCVFFGLQDLCNIV